MKYRLIIVSILVLVSMNMSRAEDTTKSDEQDLKTIVKEKTENIKKDTGAIKTALEKEFDASAKVINKETDKIMDQVEKLKADFEKHGKLVNASRKQIGKELEDKVEELEELIDSIDWCKKKPH